MLLYRKRCLQESQRKALWLSFVRSCHLEMFFKMDVLKNFTNFTGKNLCWNFFLDKVADLKVCNFIKKRLQHRCFPVEFHKFLRASFFTEHLRWLLLEGVFKGTSLVKILQCCHFNIFGINHRCFRKIPIKKNIETFIVSLVNFELINAGWVWDMFKLNNKGTRTTSCCLYCILWTYFTPCSSVSIVNFEQVNVCWES